MVLSFSMDACFILYCSMAVQINSFRNFSTPGFRIPKKRQRKATLYYYDSLFVDRVLVFTDVWPHTCFRSRGCLPTLKESLFAVLATTARLQLTLLPLSHRNRRKSAIVDQLPGAHFGATLGCGISQKTLGRLLTADAAHYIEVLNRRSGGSAQCPSGAPGRPQPPVSLNP